MPNVVFPVSAGNQRPLIIAFAGNSFGDYFAGVSTSNDTAYKVNFGTAGGSPFSWALYKHFPADVLIDAGRPEDGGYNMAVGGSGSEALVEAAGGRDPQLDQIDLMDPKPDVVVIGDAAQNSGGGNLAQADEIYDDVEAFTLGALAKGVGQVWICAAPPNTTLVGTTAAHGRFHLNRRYEMLARATPGVVFIDDTHLIRDLTPGTENNGSSSMFDWRGTNAGADGYSSDTGVHRSGLAGRATGALIAPLLEKIARPRLRRSPTFSDYRADFPYGNVLGGAGAMIGTSGTIAGGSGGGDVAGTGDTGETWNLTTQNSVTATPSIGTNARGYPEQIITLGGTASADANVDLALAFYGPSGEIAEGLFELEASLRFEGVTGLNSWAVLMSAPSGGGLALAGQGPLQSLTLTEEMFVFPPRPILFNNSGFSTKTVTIRLSFLNGASPTGEVGISEVGLWRVG